MHGHVVIVDYFENGKHVIDHVALFTENFINFNYFFHAMSKGENSNYVNDFLIVLFGKGLDQVESVNVKRFYHPEHGSNGLLQEVK